MRLDRNFHFAFRLRTNIPHLPPLAIFSHLFPSPIKSRIGFDLRYVQKRAYRTNAEAAMRIELIGPSFERGSRSELNVEWWALPFVEMVVMEISVPRRTVLNVPCSANLSPLY
jgi:hypothetical protein